ncbi:MAG: PAS domain-containing sensor histidine kinase [Myxococcota bacterium]
MAGHDEERDAAALCRALDHAGVGTWRYDCRTGVLAWSKRTARMFGMRHDAFDGALETMHRRCHPDDVTRLKEAHADAIASTGRFRVQYRAVHPDGAITWHDAHGGVVYDEVGSAVQLFGTVTDITELKRAEERDRAIVEALPGVGFVLDEHGRYLDFFARDDRLLVEDRTFLRGRLVSDVMSPEAAAPVMAAIERAVASGVTQSLEYPLVVRGRTTWFEARVAALPARPSEPRTVLWLAHDITARHHMVDERERMVGALGRKNAELERLTYTVSHDLKSPLVTINGFLGMLRRDLEDENAEAVEEDLEQMERAATRMRVLLAELLELSRVGRTTGDITRVSLDDVVQEVLGALRPQLAEGAIDVAVTSPLPTVDADRRRMLELWQNLVENAILHMGPVAQPRIEIGIRAHASPPVFFVRDNGRGVDAHHRDRIFELFERLDPTRPGSGVGLSLVRRIVERHGGTVWLDAEDAPPGATFCFTLPGAPRSAPPPPLPP